MVEQIQVRLYLFKYSCKKKTESMLMVSDLVGILSIKFSLKLNKFKLPGKLYIHPPETLEEGNGN